jgi:hypothetical protein
MASLLWLDDFNDPPPRLALPEPEEDLPPPEPPADPRLEGWREGYAAGHRQAMLQAQRGNAALIAALNKRLDALDARLDQIAADSAAQIGDLLIAMLIQATPEAWHAEIKTNLQTVIEAVRPSFHLDPKLHVHHDAETEIGLRELPALLKALEDIQATDWAISLRWDTKQPPKAALPALRNAAAPAQAAG